jgi:hypothetical protein
VSSVPPVLRELSADFGGELIGIDEFGTLVGFDRSTVAQMRSERKRDRADFPPVVSESGRSFLHRLEELIDWTQHSRYEKFVAIRVDEIASWRIERRTRSLIESIGVSPARRVFAALAIAARNDTPLLLADDPLGSLMRSDDPLIQDLTADLDVTDADVSALADEVLRALDSPQVIDRNLVALGTHQPGTPHRTTDAHACMAAVLLDAGPGHTVYEPTSGECEILLRVAQLADARGDHLGAVAGSDIDPEASLIGRSRLRLAGVDAHIGAEVSPGTVDRLIIDPGARIDRRDLARWVRSLHRDGRVVLITRINGAEQDLLAELWPTAIVFPPQRPAGTQGAVALWVSHPFCERPPDCRIVDLRGTTPPTASSIEQRLNALTEALDIRSSTPLLEADPSWRTALSEHIPTDPNVSILAAGEIEDRLAHAVAGTLGYRPEVIAANERYALALAKELERLIGAATAGEWHPFDRIDPPQESPDGVLASKASDDARRVIARLADTFEGVRRWTRRTQ